MSSFSTRRGERWLTPFSLLAPALLIMLLIVAYPFLQSIRISFFDISLLRPDVERFNGLKNYFNLFKTEVFYTALVNSIFWIVGCVAWQFILGMLGALLLKRDFKGKGLVRGLSLVPWATSSVLVALMWSWMLNSHYGVINDLLVKSGLAKNYLPWLAQSQTALLGVMLSNIWQGAPFFAVMLLAAMQTVPEELYEAAYIDGGGKWKQFWHVTIPLIMPTIIITTMLRIIWTANYMDLILIMTGGGPGYSSMTMPVLAYITAYKRLKVGEGAAMAVFQAAFLGIFLGFYLKLLQKKSEDTTVI